METGAPKLLSLFPLPNVVLFPGVFLPLHVFEPRYRALVADALEGDRRIGMMLLQPGWESDYEGRPPLFPIGCSGAIVQADRLDDGRYHIMLRGLERVRVLEEDVSRPYRRAAVEALPDTPLDAQERQALSAHRARIESLLSESVDPAEAAGAELLSRTSSMPDLELVHTLAQGLDLAPLEKQSLLQESSLSRRAQLLVDLLEMKRWDARLPQQSETRH